MAEAKTVTTGRSSAEAKIVPYRKRLWLKRDSTLRQGLGLKQRPYTTARSLGEAETVPQGKDFGRRLRTDMATGRMAARFMESGD